MHALCMYNMFVICHMYAGTESLDMLTAITSKCHADNTAHASPTNIQSGSVDMAVDSQSTCTFSGHK